MGHDPEHSATMFIPPDVYERMRNSPRDDTPSPSVHARVTRPRYDGEERTLASQRDLRCPAPQAAIAAAVVEEPSSLEVDPRELLDANGAARHPMVPVTANGTLLMEAMPYLVGRPEETRIVRRVPAPHMVANSAGNEGSFAASMAPERMGPDSARVRRELDEMSMVFEPHALSRRLATASDDEMARYLESLRVSQGLPPQEAGQMHPAPAAMPAPAHWQSAPAAVQADASQARFDPIAQRFTPPPGFEPEATHAPQSAFAPHPSSPDLAPAYAGSPPGYASDQQAYPYAQAQQPPAYAPPQHAYPYAQPQLPAYASNSTQPSMSLPSPSPSPFALPPAQPRPPLASMPPQSQMVPGSMFVPAAPPKKSGNTAMFAVMFLAALVGVGAVTYVALRAGPQGAVTGPLSSLRVAEAG